jgi:hypothetical protein
MTPGAKFSMGDVHSNATYAVVLSELDTGDIDDCIRYLRVIGLPSTGRQRRPALLVQRLLSDQLVLMQLVQFPAFNYCTSVYLDHFEQVVLDGTCNPNGMLGQGLAVIPEIRPQYDDSISCNQQKGCVWDPSHIMSCPNLRRLHESGLSGARRHAAAVQ